jgi:hypothetical protein
MLRTFWYPTGRREVKMGGSVSMVSDSKDNYMGYLPRRRLGHIRRRHW